MGRSPHGPFSCLPPAPRSPRRAREFSPFTGGVKKALQNGLMAQRLLHAGSSRAHRLVAGGYFDNAVDRGAEGSEAFDDRNLLDMLAHPSHRT